MDRTNKIGYILSGLLFIILSLLLFLPFDNVKIILACILLIFSIIVFQLLKKRNLLSINKKQIILLIFVSSILYVAIYYISGIYFGFNQSFYSNIKSSFYFKTIIPIVISIICVECLRSVLSALKNKIINSTFFILSIIVDVLLFSNVLEIDNFNTFMNLVGLVVLPSITGNILYQYLVKRYGIYPNIIFRLITTLSVYLIPVVPAVSDSLFALYKLVVPFLIYLFINLLYEKKSKKSIERKSKPALIISSILLAVFMVANVMLISNQFKYGILVVGSESMSGEINKGDAIIFEKFENQIIKEGEIIVFNKNNNTVIHRVIDINSVNGQIRYYTKGDANETNDSGFVTASQIIGITEFKISYIGYPTIWINNIFSK